MERIRNKGNSSLLFKLADRMGNARSVGGRVTAGPVAPSCINVVPMSIAMDPLELSHPASVNVVPETVVITSTKRNELIAVEDEDVFRANATTERIVVKSGLCNDPDIDKLKLSKCKRLRELVAGNDCLQFMKELKLSGFEYLERVVIGTKCFCKSDGGVFEVSGCERLKSVVIGSGCCVNWKSFTVKKCSIEEVIIGDGCFVNCESIVFESVYCPD